MFILQFWRVEKWKHVIGIRFFLKIQPKTGAIRKCHTGIIFRLPEEETGHKLLQEPVRIPRFKTEERRGALYPKCTYLGYDNKQKNECTQLWWTLGGSARRARREQWPSLPGSSDSPLPASTLMTMAMVIMVIIMMGMMGMMVLEVIMAISSLLQVPQPHLCVHHDGHVDQIWFSTLSPSTTLACASFFGRLRKSLVFLFPPQSEQWPDAPVHQPGSNMRHQNSHWRLSGCFFAYAFNILYQFELICWQDFIRINQQYFPPLPADIVASIYAPAWKS